MQKLDHANWIGKGELKMDTLPTFVRRFALPRYVRSATMVITALGMYEATFNGQRVGEFVFAPGWTAYGSRLQVQTYDVTALLREENTWAVTVGEGWYDGRLPGWIDTFPARGTALIAALSIIEQNGNETLIVTNSSWEVYTSKVISSSIYDGEVFDATIAPVKVGMATVVEHDHGILIPQEGEEVREMGQVLPVKRFVTPAGEDVIDFGQNLTGYVRFAPRGKKGEVVELSHAEVLDKDGNFYTENLRSAKEKIIYTLSGEKGEPIYNPHFSFQGFRYIRLDRCPKGMDVGDFTAIVVHSDMARTGDFACGVPLVNRLFRNVIWGQRGNFLDVPTDCPQRDERLGWTGDAQVFCRAASYNFDTSKFFRKWLRDLAADQLPDGRVPHVIPRPMLGSIMKEGDDSSAAWADACTIIPWQMYLTYGDEGFLRDQFYSAKLWVDYLHGYGDQEFLWLGGTHYGDWLGLDAPEGSYKGSTDPDLIASAFFAHSTALLIKMGKVLGCDMGEYETLHQNIVAAFRKRFMPGGELTSHTQTAHVLALHFGLTATPVKTAATLAQMIADNGYCLQTGFVGTPYLLHVLSSNGYEKLAYTLLLQEKFPSWLFSVKLGATTMWEHWDGMKADGSMWSKDMNSFNHYAYGAVADWLYGVAAGINPCDDAPGFRSILFKPLADKRMGHVEASIRTKYGVVASAWVYEGEKVRYTFTVPTGCTGKANLHGKEYTLAAGETTIIL